jgi:hypothetical protein
MRLATISLLLILGAGPVSAQEQASSSRFVFVPVDAGVLRLDADTGEVSLCAEATGALSCTRVADDMRQDGQEPGLAERIAALESRVEALEKREDFFDDSEAMDRVATLAERMMRQFFNMVREMQGEMDGDEL